jgi:hypothetical protein
LRSSRKIFHVLPQTEASFCIAGGILILIGGGEDETAIIVDGADVDAGSMR